MPITFNPSTCHAYPFLTNKNPLSTTISLASDLSFFQEVFGVALLLSSFQMFGSGEKSSNELSISYHRLHRRKEVIAKKLPKGFLAIRVGQGSEQQRIVVPVLYLCHPLFAQLLKEAEEEYGFEYHQGTITIPCHVEEFRDIQGTIEREKSLQHHHVGCFKSLP